MSKWVEVKWEQVIKIINGKNQKAVEDVKGKHPIYGSGGIMGYAKDYLCEEDTVIIGRKGSINKPIYVKEKFWNVDTAFGLVARKDQLIPKYLYYFCLQFNFEKLNTTVTIPSLTKSNLLNILMPLPPIETQKRVAEVLDKAQELIDNRKEQIDLLDDFIQSVFIEMFGDPVSNPMGWKKNKIGEISKVESGSTPSRDIPEYYKNGKFPWIKTNEVNFKPIYKSQEYITELAIQQTTCKLYPENTVLVAMYGQGVTRGKVALMKLEAATNQACAAILPNKKTVPVFLFKQLVNRYEELRELGRGGNQPNLNLSMVRNFEIIIPPLALQNEFAQIVAKTEQQRELLEKSLTEMENNFNSIMQRAFRGELF